MGSIVCGSFTIGKAYEDESRNKYKNGDHIRRRHDQFHNIDHYLASSLCKFRTPRSCLNLYI